MAILASCACGRTLSFANDRAGARVECPDCGRPVAVPAVVLDADGIFARDRFIVRKRLLSLAHVHDVSDDDGGEILHVRRSRHALRTLIGVLVGSVAFLLAAVFGLWGLFATAAALGRLPGDVLVAVGILPVLLAIVWVTVVAYHLSMPRIRVSFSADPGFRGLVLETRQDFEWTPFRVSHTVVCPRRGPIARITKSFSESLLRTRWWCHDADGSLLCTAWEDFLFFALVRRILMLRLLHIRKNYVIVRGAQRRGTTLGEVIRRVTLVDHYVLDLAADPHRSLDRRIALALALLLDT